MHRKLMIQDCKLILCKVVKDNFHSRKLCTEKKREVFFYQGANLMKKILLVLSGYFNAKIFMRLEEKVPISDVCVCRQYRLGDKMSSSQAATEYLFCKEKSRRTYLWRAGYTDFFSD